MQLVPQAEWTRFSHRLILHGRQVCHARKPQCESCTLADLCPKVGVAEERLTHRAQSAQRQTDRTARDSGLVHCGEPMHSTTRCSTASCRYVRIDTQADERSTTYPSTPGQLELGRMLRDELLAMGYADARQNEHGIVFATIPGNVARRADHRAQRPRRYVAGDLAARTSTRR